MGYDQALVRSVDVTKPVLPYTLNRACHGQRFDSAAYARRRPGGHHSHHQHQCKIRKISLPKSCAAGTPNCATPAHCERRDGQEKWLQDNPWADPKIPTSLPPMTDVLPFGVIKHPTVCITSTILAQTPAKKPTTGTPDCKTTARFVSHLLKGLVAGRFIPPSPWIHSAGTLDVKVAVYLLECTACILR